MITPDIKQAMKRKIIKQGHSTLTITLPNKWAKDLKLNAGDEVDIFESDGTIIVNGKQKSQPKTTTIDITGLRVPMIWRFFQSAYREGYDEIKVVFDPNQKVCEGAYDYYASHFEYARMGEKNPKIPTTEMLQGLINRFIGVAIIDQRDNYCIVKEMGELTSKEFNNSLERIFILILELFDKIISIIKENDIGDISVCKVIHQMDTNIDRFIDYCCRINNRINDSNFQKNKPVMFSTLFILELLGDEFKYLARHLAASKKRVVEILPFAQRVRDHFELYHQLFYKFDRKKAVEFGENDFQVYNEHFKWKEESSNSDVRSIRRHLMQISKFIFCLMELRIEMEF